MKLDETSCAPFLSASATLSGSTLPLAGWDLGSLAWGSRTAKNVVNLPQDHFFVKKHLWQPVQCLGSPHDFALLPLHA